MDRQSAIENLHSLLHNELAAIETYRQVIEQLGSDLGKTDLGLIHDDHREAANGFRDHIELNGQATPASPIACTT